MSRTQRLPTPALGLQDHLLEEFKFIKIQFLSPNTTVSPAYGQQIISNFKKLYTKAFFEHCFELTEATNLTLREFWKYHFNIVACIKTIEKASEGVIKRRSLTSAWEKLWAECVIECNSEAFVSVPVEPVVNEIMSLAKRMGLEMKNNDIDELVEDHSQEMTTEELVELQCVSQKEAVESSSEEEEEVTAKQQSSGTIRETSMKQCYVCYKFI
ncbi:uncharacterized protein LOC124594967 [Schistocerca americana]|uniref:uncharacterized protein LOC124594967 n=1 Tax=Schistocerca americana TaxID=7009 RepID=UPI001F4FD7E1|nr:uncharacterized protein LOC124594967 [Schistocerca americana]